MLLKSEKYGNSPVVWHVLVLPRQILGEQGLYYTLFVEIMIDSLGLITDNMNME